MQRADAIRKGDSVALSAPSLEQDYPKDEQDCSKDGKVSLSNAATVICVVKTPTENKELVMLPGGLRITPYHPIRIASRFLFPCNANVAERNRNLPAESGAVYTFVLDKVLDPSCVSCVCYIVVIPPTFYVFLCRSSVIVASFTVVSL